MALRFLSLEVQGPIFFRETSSFPLAGILKKDLQSPAAGAFAV